MKYEFIFLCLIIPGPDYPGKNLNVMLKPLIEELKELWKGVEAYDVFKKQIFKLRVAYLWSVHDFVAYAIFTGWSTHGRLTCPYCGSDTDCFCLARGGKITEREIGSRLFLNRFWWLNCPTQIIGLTSLL
jgi:hypothetical protein